jgi:hypothetical protein
MDWISDEEIIEMTRARDYAIFGVIAKLPLVVC